MLKALKVKKNQWATVLLIPTMAALILSIVLSRTQFDFLDGFMTGLGITLAVVTLYLYGRDYSKP